MMRNLGFPWLLAASSCLLAQPFAIADEPTEQVLEQSYTRDVRPLMARYCHACHSAAKDKIEADVDLAEFATWNDVRKDPRTWQKVREMLDSGQMPPKDAPRPTPEERSRLRDWVRAYLTLEARARAGDPGRVVLRRLSNVEYTYTLRDLTGVDSLDPAREFPIDGAAGEGFTNTGNALVMSPALLTKYLDAAKLVTDHAVLLPDGLRFSNHATRRDWTNDILQSIREFYREYTDPRGGEQVNLQGIVFETNEGGRLPLEKYVAATISQRQALEAGTKTLDSVAREHGLNPRYLQVLWTTLTQPDSSFLIDHVRARWRAATSTSTPTPTPTPAQTAALTQEIARWQKALWKFASVGHIGKLGGPKRWMEPVDPIAPQQSVRIKIPENPGGSDVRLTLFASNAGDGDAQDVVVWSKPRLVAPGRPDLMLRDVRAVTRDLEARRARMFARVASYLEAASEAGKSQEELDLAQLARKHEVDEDELRAWLDYLGIGAAGVVPLSGHLSHKIPSSAGYDFIQGWGSPDLPAVLANSSNQPVRVPGNMKPHGVALHPTPTLRVAAGWRSPVNSKLRLEAGLTHAHPECGNGVSWRLELRHGSTRTRLASGVAQGATAATAGPLEITVRKGDLVVLSIGPRDGNHACDLTAIELSLRSLDAAGPTWSLSEDVSGDILAGNPHADRSGNAGTWHFFSEPETGGDASPVIPEGSVLARWLANIKANVNAAAGEGDRHKLAEDLRTLLTGPPPAAKDSSDAVLHRQLTSLGGPLFRGLSRSRPTAATPGEGTPWGLDPALFGKRPDGKPIDDASLCAQAPSRIEVRLPAELAAGSELVADAMLEPELGRDGSVQVGIGIGSTNPDSLAGLANPDSPILASREGKAWARIEAGFEDFRRVFPAALCYTKIVPVDEVVTLTLFYREDDHLVRLMLDEREAARLDRLWEELHYVSQDALTLVDAYAQLMEYATQDADPKVFEPLRKPIQDRAAAFRKLLADTQPRHLDSVLRFADQAYRRPLTAREADALRALYQTLRSEGLPHEEAIRLTLARVLVAPAFLYRVEKPVVGAGQGPVTDWELASRLSYFLWSSQPDDELRRLAAEGRLHEPEVLRIQTARMLRDPKIRRLATEFGCQWLQIHDFENLDEKSERHFPTFAALRGEIYEESILFFTNLFQNNESVLDLLTGDYTFLNEALAKHYGIPGVTGANWRRVDGVKRFGRGGILAQATTLSKQSGASRTSPILRGNWINEVLLGDRLPRPPKGVPQLPDDETATAGLTVRQLVERHSSDPKCVICHERIDAFGFALERYDAIGRLRSKDLADRPIETTVKVRDGEQFDGLDGLRNYLLTSRLEEFSRQFCRKLLGYSLGRSVQLSDEPLLAEMLATLKTSDYRIAPLAAMIVGSRQFREIRGRESASEE